MTQTKDESFMALALEQARLGWGLTSPNPMVGAVVVDDNGDCIGRGYHHGAGQPHAEPNALADAGEAARGATLYVTLEPCCTFGRTPPCTEAILHAGIRRVVMGCLDPNPKHAGRGVDILKQQGIEVISGVLEEECRRLNRAFFKWITTGMPFVCLKMAMTLDGKIATASGNSKWVTGPKARSYVQTLRQWADAVMVGGATARIDNPSLLVREPKNWPCQPQRIIWTSKSLVRSSTLMTDTNPHPIVAKPTTPEEWNAFLAKLGRDNITVLLMEDGGELAANALKSRIVDEVQFFIAPKLLGGRDSRPVVAGDNPDSLSEALPLQNVTCQQIGQDWLFIGNPADAK